MRWSIGIVVGAAMHWAWLPEAEACSCAPFDEARVHPPDEASDVPPNTRVLVVAPDEPDTEGEISLRDEETGEAVSLAIERWTGRYSTSSNYAWARPNVPLDSGRRYEVAVDDEIVSTFEVGEEHDEIAPEFGGIDELDLYRFESNCVSSCWEEDAAYHRVWATFPEPPEDAVLAVLELTDGDGGELLRVPITSFEGATDAVLDSNTCEAFPPPRLSEGDTLCARITAYDGSGHASGADVERCATVQRCFSECDLIPLERGVCPEAPPPDEGGDSRGADAGSSVADGSPGGCAVAPSSAPPPIAALLGLAGLLRLRVRRQRATRRHLGHESPRYSHAPS